MIYFFKKCKLTGIIFEKNIELLLQYFIQKSKVYFRNSKKIQKSNLYFRFFNTNNPLLSKINLQNSSHFSYGKCENLHIFHTKRVLL